MLTTFVGCVVSLILQIKFGKFCSTTRKPLNFSESTPSNATNKENMRLENQEIITPRVPHLSAELNVQNVAHQFHRITN